jgi:hypothetical protein
MDTPNTKATLLQILNDLHRTTDQNQVAPARTAELLICKNAEEPPADYLGASYTPWENFIEDGDTDDDAKRKYREWLTVRQQEDPAWYQQHISEWGVLQ